MKRKTVIGRKTKRAALPRSRFGLRIEQLALCLPEPESPSSDWTFEAAKNLAYAYIACQRSDGSFPGIERAKAYMQSALREILYVRAQTHDLELDESVINRFGRINPYRFGKIKAILDSIGDEQEK